MGVPARTPRVRANRQVGGRSGAASAVGGAFLSAGARAGGGTSSIFRACRATQRTSPTRARTLMVVPFIKATVVGATGRSGGGARAAWSRRGTASCCLLAPMHNDRGITGRRRPSCPIATGISSCATRIITDRSFWTVWPIGLWGRVAVVGITRALRPASAGGTASSARFVTGVVGAGRIGAGTISLLIDGGFSRGKTVGLVPSIRTVVEQPLKR